MKGANVVVLFSGGLDSTVAMAMYAEYNNIYPIYIQYGNRAPQELKQAHELIKHYNIPNELKVVDLSNLREIMVNADGSIPKEAPYRNALFTMVAAAYAVQVDAFLLVDGNHKEDGLTGFADGTPEASDTLNKLLFAHAPHHASYPLVLTNPLKTLMKCDVVAEGSKLNVPFELTTSCYNIDNDDNIHCGVCESCHFRKLAFEDACVKDPTVYRK